MIDFTPLWETMKEKGVSTYVLIKDYQMSKGTIHALKHNRSVTLNTLETICQILEVPIEKVVRFVDEEGKVFEYDFRESEGLLVADEPASKE